MLRWLSCLGCVLLCVAATGCADDPEAPWLGQPRMLDPVAVVGEVQELDFTVQAEDPDGDLARLQMVLTRPSGTTATDGVPLERNGRVQASVLVEPQSPGVYTLRLTAIDQGGRISNPVETTFEAEEP